MHTHLRLGALFSVALSTTQAFAQLELTEPEPSPAAAVEQTVGITRMRVTYNRPAVAGRKVFGELVPYGEVWRAGANANTTLNVSTPVKIAGKLIPAGTYGVHMIPTDKQWTVILSTISSAWGSYSYDAKEDAVRAPVTPQASEAFEERLSYRFDDVSDSAATLTLRWEKTKVALKIESDTPAAVMASMRLELRGANQFVAASWNQAAEYWLKHGGSLDEATSMADRSLQMKETYRALLTRAAIAEKKNDSKLAASLTAKADKVATEVDINAKGYALMQQKKIDEAIAVFARNVKTYPESWNAYDSLGEAYMVKGDKANAASSYKKALALVKNEENKKRIEGIVQRLSK